MGWKMWHQTPFQNWSWQRRHGFTTQTRYCATKRYVGNTSLHTRLFLSSHKHAGEKWLSSNAPLFIAPQTCRWKMAPFRRASFIAPHTRGWKMARFRRASFYCVTNMQVENGSLQTHLFLSRHKHADGKWLAADMPLFVATQTRWWKMAPCGRTAKPTRPHVDCTIRTVRVPVALHRRLAYQCNRCLIAVGACGMVVCCLTQRWSS
jgi:hypothetical protein